MATSFEKAQFPNSCQHTIQSPRGDYVIQVSWPLSWTEDRVPPENDPAVSALYLVDGNAYFSTAVDITRRLEFTNTTRCIVVGVSYPPSQYVYDWRRGPDLTPPTPDKKYEMPLDRNGKPRTDLTFGEADKFLEFISDQVVPFVEGTLFAHISNLSTNRKALFGHSYGGLFALSALYTNPGIFDFFIAASPTIWWNNSSLVKYQEADFHRLAEKGGFKIPSLMVTWGSAADELKKEPGMSDEQFEKMKACAEEKELKPSALALVGRLENSPGVRSIWTRQFDGEDHGSSAVTALQRGVMKFLTEMS